MRDTAGWWFACGGAGIALGTAVAVAPTPVVAVIAAALLSAMAILTFRAQDIVVVSTVWLYTASASGMLDGYPALQNATRIIAVCLCGSLLFTPTIRQIPRSMLACGFIGLACYALAILPHRLVILEANSELGYISAVFAIGMILTRVPFAHLQRVLIAALTPLVAASLVLGLSVPSVGLNAGRLRGVLYNANALGFLAALLLILVIVTTHTSSTWLIAGTAAAALVWSGSRSALAGIAAAMIAVIALRLRGRFAKRFVARALLLGCIAGSLAVVFGASAEHLLILRTNNSREDGLAYSLAVLKDNWLFGIGFEREGVQIASSPLRWAANGGVFALACVVSAYVVMLVAAWRCSGTAWAIGVFGVASSLFEGWIFAGGSVLALVFWLAFGAASMESRPVTRSTRPHGVDAPLPVGARG